MNLTRIGVLFFSVAALAGPLYTVDAYNSIRDVISLLGAQNTQYSFIMVAGFIALSTGIFIDGVRHFSKNAVPFMVFGLCMGLAGVFAHRPLVQNLDSSEIEHQLHSSLATLAGVAITIGVLWNAFRQPSPVARTIELVLAGVCLGMPLCMLAFEDFQGIIQRVMYVLVFAWFWYRYPLKTPPVKRRPSDV